MTRKVGSTPKPVSASKAAKAQKKPARAKAFGKKPASGKQGFPRTTWQDTNRLGREIDRGQGAIGRLNYTRPSPGQPGVSRPPMQARYGLPTPRPDRPPIQARYGLPSPRPDRPPVQARYGLPRPRPDRPPIQAKYGVPSPNRPPIQAKYGVPRPGPGTERV